MLPRPCAQFLKGDADCYDSESNVDGLMELQLWKLCYAFLNGSPALGHFFCIFVLGPRHFGSRSPALGHACRFAVGSCRIPEDSMGP